jgi:hypothetical protein
MVLPHVFADGGFPFQLHEVRHPHIGSHPTKKPTYLNVAENPSNPQQVERIKSRESLQFGHRYGMIQLWTPQQSDLCSVVPTCPVYPYRHICLGN